MPTPRWSPCRPTCTAWRGARRSATRGGSPAATPGGAVYGQSKLANLLFTHELDRRAREKDLPLKALAAHPGFAGTHLAANGQYGRAAGGIATILDASIKAVSQPAAHGAWPVLMAATADLPGATYVGPAGSARWPARRGWSPPRRSPDDADAQRRLWELSEETTGIRYP